ncbi:sodium channel protein Nach-like isoform X2 [Cimex lectularius]|nr:sodium channel protein Nach-like isoform X2 [Cimex lectularius]
MWWTTSLSLSTWYRFSQNPTVVSIERNYKEWRTNFPAVSLCPLMKYESESVDAYVETNFKHVEDKDGLTFFIEGLVNTTLINNELNGDNIHIKPKDYWKLLEDVKLVLKYNVSNSNMNMYSVLEMTKSFTESGLCYVYNSAIAQYSSPKCWKTNNCPFEPDIQTFKGSPLDGDIFAQLMNMNTGYELFIHGPWEVPDAAIANIRAENNSYKTLDVTAQSIYSTEAAAELTISQRKCRHPGESNLAISPVYSYNMCRMDCRVKKMISMCNCVPHFYRHMGRKTKVCNSRGLACVKKHRDFFIKLRDPVTEAKVQCDCVPSCNEDNFLVDTDNTMSWNLGTNLKWGLTKYPKMRLKRDVIFGWSDLLVSIGGTAGLFLGCSLLSFAEIFYFLTLQLFLFILQRCNN